MKDEAPQVYAIQRGRSRWKLSRRDLAAAAAVAGAAAMPGCGPNCRGVNAHAGPVLGLAFAPGGKLLASGDRMTIKLWSLTEGALVKTFAGGGLSLAISPDGRLLASGNPDASVKLWSLPDGALLKRLAAESGRVDSVAIGADGRLAVSGSDRGAVELWSLPDGALLKTFTGHWGSVESVAISRDGRLLASANGNSTIALWSLPDGALLKTMLRAGPALSISPDGRLLVSGDTKDVKLWSLPDGAPVKTLSGPISDYARWVSSTAISPDGKLLAAGNEAGAVKLWWLPDGRPLPECLMDVEVSTTDVKGIQYTRGGASYTQGCGSTLPAGAVCTCNCVPGKLCSCVSHTGGGGGGGGHYWHPN